MNDKQNLKNRMSKIKGQIEGVERMIDEDRDSLDIVQQIVAINSALKTVGIEILKDETSSCVTDQQKFEVLLKNLFKLK
jgi:DNA-binding FrmR family transcriptional regulator